MKDGHNYPDYPVIYGLLDNEGEVYYVGQTKKLKNRISCYRRGEFHGNKKLERKALSSGEINFCILAHNPEDLNQSEFEEISKREDLCNIIKDPRNVLACQLERKPWNVKGTSTPSRLWFMSMRNKFGKKCDDVKDAISKMNDSERMKYECSMAEMFCKAGMEKKVERWVLGVLNG